MHYLNELKLRDCLITFLPIIDKNFARAENDWKKEIISKSAFEYIKQRQVVSHVLSRRPDITGEELYEICAPITIDIRVAIDALEEKLNYESVFNEWLGCFDIVGYTDRQPVFNYPMKNLNDFERKNKEKK